MPPIAAFVIGVFCSELMQWALWGTGHPGQRALGYFADGWAHFAIAWAVCTMVGVLWALNGLDVLVGWLPDALTSSWAKSGVPYTPQIGIVLGFAIDAMADKVAFAFRARFGAAPTTNGGTAS